MSSSKPTSVLICAFVLTALVACGSPAAAPNPGPKPASGDDASAAPVPHGFVAGATEAQEPQIRLSYLSTEAGSISMIDPLSGNETDTFSLHGAESMQHDGRFLFLRSTAGAGLNVIDTGVWAVDHGDHKHYYHTTAQQLHAKAPVPAGPVAGDGHWVGIFDEQTGDTSVLNRKTLETGVLTVETTLSGTPHTGLAIPYKGRMLITGSPGEDKLPTTVAAFDLPVGKNVGADTDKAAPESNATGSLLPTACPALRGHASTPHGVVFGCSDGILVISEEEGSLMTTKVPYPENKPNEPATSFSYRTGSSELTALAGTTGLWHVDVATLKLTFMPTPEPVVVASTAGNGSPVLAVGQSGTLYALDPLTGLVENQSTLLTQMKPGPPPSLVLDSGRAYLSDPASALIHEIDYRDNLRVARTFTTTALPAQLVETGL